MNKCIKFFVFLLLGFVPTIYAAPKPKTPAKAVHIAVVSVDPKVMTITVGPRNSMSTEANTYKLTPATVIEVHRNPATLADLKAEMVIHS